MPRQDWGGVGLRVLIVSTSGRYLLVALILIDTRLSPLPPKQPTNMARQPKVKQHMKRGPERTRITSRLQQWGNDATSWAALFQAGPCPVRVVVAVAIVLLFFAFTSSVQQRGTDEHQSGRRRSRPRIMFVVSLYPIE